MDNDGNLKYRFTSYITKVIQFASQDYLKKLERQKREIPTEASALEELIQSELASPEGQEDVGFSNQLLETALRSLSDLRKKILERIFIDEMKPADIAVELDCPVDFIYQEKYQALKKLKKHIERLEDDETS